MKEIVRITIGLTISCLVAAFVMGTVFAVTHRAKKNNEHLNVQETMFDLLGYSKNNPPPSDLKLHTVYRYVIEDGETRSLGYMVPVKRRDQEGYALLVIDLEGKPAAHYDLDITPEQASEGTEREHALEKVLKPPKRFTYADSTIVADLGGKRMAYLLPGEFPGFKTFIQVMLALDSSFKVLGLEIMEQEEDPGLGADIQQPFFKNQFKGKTFKEIKELKVVKKPLPEEYKKYLENETRKQGMFSEKELEAIRSKYQDQDIYALTGATISSRAVTNGVKNMVKKFAYRIRVLDDAVKTQDIPAAY